MSSMPPGLVESHDEVSYKFLEKTWPLQMPPVSKAVLIALADRADDDGIAWPAVDDLVTRTCFGRRAVQRAITDLAKAGLIVVGTRKGGFRKAATTVYRLNLPEVAEKEEAEITWSEGRTPDASRVSQSRSASDSHAARPTVTDDGLTCARIITEPSMNPQGSITEPSAPLRAADSDEKSTSRNPQSSLFAREQGSPQERQSDAGSSQQPPSAAERNPRARVAKAPDRTAEAMEIWNRVCGGRLATVSTINEKRRRDFAARFRDSLNGDLTAWEAVCQSIIEDDFKTGGGPRGWMANFDWAIRPGKITEILESLSVRRTPARQHAGSPSTGNGGGLLGAVQRMYNQEFDNA